MTIPGIGGRPVKWKTPEELEQKIDDYFRLCHENGKEYGSWEEAREETIIRPYTLEGLAFALDTTTETLRDYRHNKAAFSATIIRARELCKIYAAECLFTNKNTKGIEFSLKNNYGYEEKRTLNVNDISERPESDIDNRIAILINIVPEKRITGAPGREGKEEAPGQIEAVVPGDGTAKP